MATEARPSQVEALGRFAAGVTWDHLSERVRAALPLHVLDALGCGIAALDAPPVRAAREAMLQLGGRPTATLLGGGRTSPDRAALVNGAAIRYLDFNDCYLGPEEACHPSDNVAPVLAGAEFAGAGGRDLLTALAVAYAVQIRLSERAPVRPRGFDHVTHGAYAVAAGVSRVLGLDAQHTAHAIAMAGTALNALRVTRTGSISNWKGLAYPNTAMCAVNATFLAGAGVTGPREVFEGKLGFMETVVGPFDIEWTPAALEAVLETDLKRHDAEGHAQSVLEAVLQLRAREHPDPAAVERIRVWVCGAAYEIIGPGAGDKTRVTTKEEADHSLPYMVAAALTDGRVMPEQYTPERLRSADLQRLLPRVTVLEEPTFTQAFPDRHRCRVEIELLDGRRLEAAAEDWPGFHGRDGGSAVAIEKFHALASGSADRDLREALVDTCLHLADRGTAELATLLGRIGTGRGGGR